MLAENIWLLLDSNNIAMEQQMPENLNWSPLVIGGSNYRTLKLMQASPSQWRYEPTGMHKAFPLIFIWSGAFMAIILLITIIGFFIGIALVVIGIIWRRRQKKVIIFDFDKKAFWKGDKKLDPNNVNTAMLDDLVPFKEITGIQLLAETVVTRTVSNNDSNFNNSPKVYDSYEMNLVLKNGSRVNVVDHGNFNIMKLEAEAIAKRIEVPVWDFSELKA